MKVTESILSVSELVISSEQEAVRTPGCHVSAVINAILENLDERNNQFSRDDLDKFAVLGRCFETVLANGLFRPPRYSRIGEIERDGIIGSPDAYDLETDTIGEFKATVKSAKQGVLREWLWQVKSYCYMLEVNRCFIMALYINGNYKPPIPILRRYDFDFTIPELKENWLMMLREREGLWPQL